MKRISAAIVSNIEVLPGAFLLKIRAPELCATARPGQYVMVRCGDSTEMPLRRPLSIHRVYPDGRIGLLFANVGRGTEWLSQCKTGSSLDMFGPLGNGFSIDPASRQLLLVAGGIGIAPLVYLAEFAQRSDLSVKLVYGCQTECQLFPKKLLPCGVELIASTEDGSFGIKGMVTEILGQFVSEADQIFACGPLAMYKRLSEISSQLGNKPVQVLLEVVMGCGVGACLGCSINTKNGRKLVCKDGPVFDLNDIIWDEIKTPPRRGGA